MKAMKRGWIKGMIAGAVLGASAATVYGMMNWQVERKLGRAAMNAGRTMSEKVQDWFG